MLLVQGTAPAWQPGQGPLKTRWAKEVSPENAHPEYPRPQMVRKEWLNLNGLWDFAITPKDARGHPTISTARSWCRSRWNRPCRA